MSGATLDLMAAEIAKHKALVETLIEDRRELFTALRHTTVALLIAEKHLARNGEYIAELIALRLPPDRVALSKEAMERVAFRV